MVKKKFKKRLNVQRTYLSSLLLKILNDANNPCCQIITCIFFNKSIKMCFGTASKELLSLWLNLINTGFFVEK